MTDLLFARSNDAFRSFLRALGGGRGRRTQLVVRHDDTILRAVQPWTPTIHALLRHLEAVGFTGAPRVVGDGYDAGLLGHLLQRASAAAMVTVSADHQCSTPVTMPEASVR